MHKNESRLNHIAVLQSEAIIGFGEALAAAKGEARAELERLAAPRIEDDETVSTVKVFYNIGSQAVKPQVAGGETAES